MKKLINSGKQRLTNFRHGLPEVEGKTDHPRQTSQPLNMQPVNVNDIFRYRYHHGANLGSIYVLEKWLSGHMFEHASDSQSSELEGLKASVNAIGIDATRQKWEGHWAEATSDQDWNWLRNAAHCRIYPSAKWVKRAAFAEGVN
jgi:hypothetical protein